MVLGAFPSSPLTERAFVALAGMKRCADAEQLDGEAGAIFAQLGYTSFSIARFFDADRSPATKVLLGRFEPGWASRYVRHGYAGSSLIAQRMLVSQQPYSWGEVLSGAPPHPDQIRIAGEAREHGLRDGLFTPVRWRDGSFVAAVLGGWEMDLEDELARAIAEVASAFYVSEARRLLEDRGPDVTLSPRQRDCLCWVRQGKSSSDIAQILGLSTETVNEYIRAGCAKLGVRTRVQAAVEAALRGLI